MLPVLIIPAPQDPGPHRTIRLRLLQDCSDMLPRSHIWAGQEEFLFILSTDFIFSFHFSFINENCVVYQSDPKLSLTSSSTQVHSGLPTPTEVSLLTHKVKRRVSPDCLHARPCSRYVPNGTVSQHAGQVLPKSSVCTQTGHRK